MVGTWGICLIGANQPRPMDLQIHTVRFLPLLRSSDNPPFPRVFTQTQHQGCFFQELAAHNPEIPYGICPINRILIRRIPIKLIPIKPTLLDSVRIISIGIIGGTVLVPTSATGPIKSSAFSKGRGLGIHGFLERTASMESNRIPWKRTTAISRLFLQSPIS